MLAWFSGSKGGASKAAKLLESSMKWRESLLVFESKQKCEEAIVPRAVKDNENDNTEKNAK